MPAPANKYQLTLNNGELLKNVERKSRYVDQLIKHRWDLWQGAWAWLTRRYSPALIRVVCLALKDTVSLKSAIPAVLNHTVPPDQLSTEWRKLMNNVELDQAAPYLKTLVEELMWGNLTLQQLLQSERC